MLSIISNELLQDNSNHRTDKYGGSVEARSRFLVEVTQAAYDRDTFYTSGAKGYTDYPIFV